MQKIKVGDNVTLTLVGEIGRRSEEEDDKGNEAEICLEVDTVDLTSVNGPEKDDKDDATGSFEDVMDMDQEGE